jgi:hypothetical protein
VVGPSSCHLPRWEGDTVFRPRLVHAPPARYTLCSKAEGRRFDPAPDHQFGQVNRIVTSTVAVGPLAARIAEWLWSPLLTVLCRTLLHAGCTRPRRGGCGGSMLRALVVGLVAVGTATSLAGCGGASTETMRGVVVTDNPGTGGGSSDCFIPDWPGPGEFSPDISTLQVVVHAPDGTVLGT